MISRTEQSGPRAVAVTPERRGVAMILVIIAIGVAMVLALGFAIAQGTSVQLARNLTGRVQARVVAETGLEMAIAYVLRSDPNWRTEKTQGVWVQDQPFGGGTFTVTGQDGRDVNGDGIVEGDGNLANSTLDFLTLTCAGNYQGAKYTVQAVVYPAKKALMIVPDPNSLTTQDTLRRNLLQSWGWQVGLLKYTASASDFSTAAASANIIYFPAHTPLQDPVKTQLTTTLLPIVMENVQLPRQLKLNLFWDLKTYSANSVNILLLTRTTTDDSGQPVEETYTHYITSPFAVGNLLICGASDALSYCDSWLARGVLPLATKPGSAYCTLGVVEAGGLGWDGKPARARRIVLPWGGSSFSIASLNSNGLNILRRSLDYAGSTWRWPLPGISVWDRIEILDHSTVDGFDSTQGPHGGANVNANATISTNSTWFYKIVVQGTLNGDAYAGVGAKVNWVIHVTGTITGDKRTLSIPVPVPTVIAPTDMGPVGGDVTYSSGTNVISSDLHIKKLTITGNAVVQVSGPVTIYCEDTVTIAQQGQLTILPGGSLTMITQKGVQIMDNAQVNTGGDPTLVQWQMLQDTMQVSGNAQIYCQLQTYGGQLVVQNYGHFHGTFVGKRVKLQDQGGFHVDTANAGSVATTGGQCDLGILYGQRVQWVEMQ